MKNLRKVFTTLFVLCGLLLSGNIYSQNLGVKVAGVKITPENAGDIISAIGMGEGKMWYDESTHTLTLENVTLDSDRKNVIESTKDIEDFTIRLIGENTLIQRGGARMFLSAPKNTITGEGTLNVSSPLTQGIFVDLVDLEITGGCTVIATGTWGICSDSGEGSLTVNASKVIAEGEFGSVCDFSEINLIDCVITSPANCYADYGSITDDYDNVITSQVVIDKVSNDYDVIVDGIKVNDSNAANVLGDNTVEYKPETKTLYLRNVDIVSRTTPAIQASSEIIIDLQGINKIESNETAISLGASALFRGKGMIEISSIKESGIEIKSGELEISNIDGFKVYGIKGIVGAAKDNEQSPILSITKSYLTTYGQEMSLGGFSNIKMDGCHIFEPVDCIIEEGNACVDGKICNDEIVINNTIEYPIWVAGQPVTSLNYKDVFGDGKVSFDRENKVLTLNNFVYETDDASAGLAVMSDMGELSVILKGTNIINTPYIGMICSSNVTFNGDGILDVTGTSTGMVIQESKVTINEEPSISIRGDLGITSLTLDDVYGELVLNGANLSVEGAYLGTITKLKSITLNDCVMTTPENAVIEGGTIMQNGEVCTELVVFEKIKTNIGTKELDSVEISVSDNMLKISNVKVPVKTYVFDMSGKIVFEQNLVSDTNIKLNNGSYIIICGDKRQKVLVL